MKQASRDLTYLHGTVIYKFVDLTDLSVSPKKTPFGTVFPREILCLQSQNNHGF